MLPPHKILLEERILFVKKERNKCKTLVMIDLFCIPVSTLNIKVAVEAGILETVVTREVLPQSSSLKLSCGLQEVSSLSF